MHITTASLPMVSSLINTHLPPSPPQIDVYRRLGSSLNIAYLYGVFEDDRNVRLVMELCDGGALWDRMQVGEYSEVDAAVIMREVVRVIAQCHAKDVVLRDVKYVWVGVLGGGVGWGCWGEGSGSVSVGVVYNCVHIHVYIVYVCTKHNTHDYSRERGMDMPLYTATHIYTPHHHTTQKYHHTLQKHHKIHHHNRCENFLFLNTQPDAPLKAVDFGSAVHLPRGQHLVEKHGVFNPWGVCYVAWCTLAVACACL